MSILSLALHSRKEGANSPSLSRLRQQLSQKSQPYIIAVDFDGTLCQNQWPEIGPENREILHAAILLRKLGVLMILWTCREGEDLQKALEWCEQRGLSFDAVNDNCTCIMEQFDCNTRKVHADEYWDDRAVSISFAQTEDAESFSVKSIL